MKKQYSIYGVKMTGPEFQRIYTTIEMCGGWNPTKKDVENLLRNDRHPSKQVQEDIHLYEKLCKRDKELDNRPAKY